MRVYQKLAEENTSNNNAGVEHVKKMFARQRAKDLAEHAKSLMSKEKELEELKKQLLSHQSVQVLPVCLTCSCQSLKQTNRFTPET